jgi:hypothetical protein
VVFSEQSSRWYLHRQTFQREIIDWLVANRRRTLAANQQDLCRVAFVFRLRHVCLLSAWAFGFGCYKPYLRQDYDFAPNSPKLMDFLDFWTANLEGPLYRVRVAHRRDRTSLHHLPGLGDGRPSILATFGDSL